MSYAIKTIRQCLGNILIFLVVAVPLPCSADPGTLPITPAQAADNVGKQATVCGKVANTYYSRFVARQPTFINFGKPYPNHVFSVAISGEDRKNFEDRPEKLFENRNVCVTGLIELYDGKPLMAIKDQSQVQWND